MDKRKSPGVIRSAKCKLDSDLTHHIQQDFLKLMLIFQTLLASTIPALLVARTLHYALDYDTSIQSSRVLDGRS